MYLSDLALTDFRSYEQALLRLRPGVTTLIGDNGQGKTNVVEAIGYLATLSSHRVASDSALVRQGAQAAVVQARVMRGASPTTLQVEIYAGRANRARINRGQVRPAQILGIVRTIVFAPEDIELVRGDPSARRAFLDSIMVQLHPRLAGVKSEYEKALRQRAALLKSAGAARRRGGAVDAGAIDVWDVQLARLGAQLTAARAEIVGRLRPFVRDFYREVSGDAAVARIDYRASASRGVFELPTPEELARAVEVARDDDVAGAGGGGAESRGDADADSRTPAALASGTSARGEGLAGTAADGGRTSNGDYLGNAATRLVEEHERELADAELTEVRLVAAMADRREAEIARGVNLVGPHRDDLVLSLGTLPAKGYASHGESWSYALALKLAAWEVLRSDADEGEPILILDDVFAELDAKRRERLAEIVGRAGQVFVTAAVGSEIPSGLAGARFRVTRGAAAADEEPVAAGGLVAAEDAFTDDSAAGALEDSAAGAQLRGETGVADEASVIGEDSGIGGASTGGSGRREGAGDA
ncbi:MAG: DNA replication/repair protein RecF [Actinomycetaceae bacterium]|nr:DNA replication/repair protein RecF [Actinomycetaceae bacterium]